MSARRPDSSSFTHTAAVMCMALTSASPSETPDLARVSSTWGVMFRNSRCFFVLNQRYSVCDFNA